MPRTHVRWTDQEALEARRPWREEVGKPGKTVPKTPGSRAKERTCHRTYKQRRKKSGLMFLASGLRLTWKPFTM